MTSNRMTILYDYIIRRQIDLFTMEVLLFNNNNRTSHEVTTVRTYTGRHGVVRCTVLSVELLSTEIFISLFHLIIISGAEGRV